MIGISVDKREKNRKFAESLGVEFPILSDEQKTVSQEYGVLMAILRLANRVTFVIDKQGIIRRIYSSQLHSETHVREALMALKSISD